MIHDVGEYVAFVNAIRKRTMQYVKVIPNSIIKWKPAENKFSTGDLLRHIGSSQLMFLSLFEQGQWTYIGHDSSKGETVEEITQYLETCHSKFVTGLQSLGNELLTKKLPTEHGYEVSSWRLLMALVEHEVHHRGQLSTYLQLNGLQPPQIFGLKIEDLKKE